MLVQSPGSFTLMVGKKVRGDFGSVDACGYAGTSFGWGEERDFGFWMGEEIQEKRGKLMNDDC
jgi:hypothetical protein